MQARKNNDEGGNQKKKKKKQQDDKLKDVVFKVIPCLFPLVIEHILLGLGLNPDQKITLDQMELVMKAVNGSMEFLKDFIKNKQKGYIFYKEREVEKKQEK